MPATLLELEAVTCRFGGLLALDQVSLQVEQGEIFGLIGPNGAGKTTLFNLISGVGRPTAGLIRWSGKRSAASRPIASTGWASLARFRTCACSPG